MTLEPYRPSQLKGQPLFLHVKKTLVNSYECCSAGVKKFCTVLEYQEIVILRANPATPFRDRKTKKLWLHIVKHIIF